MGRSLSELAGPVMATGVVALGTAGWALAGAAFPLLTELTRFAVEWSRRSTALPVTEEVIGHRPARA